MSSDIADALHIAARTYARHDLAYRAAYAAYYATRPGGPSGETPTDEEWTRDVLPKIRAVNAAQYALMDAARAFSVGDP